MEGVSSIPCLRDVIIIPEKVSWVESNRDERAGRLLNNSSQHKIITNYRDQR
jgi:hypothetical protein